VCVKVGAGPPGIPNAAHIQPARTHARVGEHKETAGQVQLDSFFAFFVQLDSFFAFFVQLDSFFAFFVISAVKNLATSGTAASSLALAAN